MGLVKVLITFFGVGIQVVEKMPMPSPGQVPATPPSQTLTYAQAT